MSCEDEFANLGLIPGEIVDVYYLPKKGANLQTYKCKVISLGPLARPWSFVDLKIHWVGYSSRFDQVVREYKVHFGYYSRPRKCWLPRPGFEEEWNNSSDLEQIIFS